MQKVVEILFPSILIRSQMMVEVLAKGVGEQATEVKGRKKMSMTQYSVVPFELLSYLGVAVSRIAHIWML